MKKENEKKKVILIIVGVIALMLVVVGATYAYFAAQVGTGDSAKINAQTGTTDSLSFNISDIDVTDSPNKIIDENSEDSIIINANQGNFVQNGNSIGDGVKLNAHLIAGNDDNDAHYEYYVYLEISANNLEYTTPESTPELVLVVQDPTNGYIDEIEGLEKSEITLGEKSVPCFDITKASGLITIASKYQIDATSETNGIADQNWQIRVIFKNLDTDQHLNTNKTFQANLSIQSESINYLDLASYEDCDEYGCEYNDYRSYDYNSQIKNVYFVNRIAEDDELNSVVKWDLSSNKDGSIMGWLQENQDPDVPYNLYIGSNEKISIRNLSNAFDGLTSVETIDLNLSILNTSNLNDTSGMFKGCSSLKEITGIEDLDVSNVTNMSNMFSKTNSLTKLDVSKWNTHNVTDMSNMFSSNLKSSSLTEIKGLKDLDVSNVTDMSGMFYYLDSISVLDISGWKTHNVTDMSDMFASASSLTELDLSGWDTSNVTNMSDMFKDCNSLTEIKGLKDLDVSNVTDMSGMFEGNYLLKTIGDISNWNTSNVTNMYFMFERTGITKLNIGNWDTHNVTNMSYMFSSTTNLTSIDMRKATFTQVNDYEGMFGNTNSVLKVTITGEDNKNWFIDKGILTEDHLEVLSE